MMLPSRFCTLLAGCLLLATQARAELPPVPDAPLEQRLETLAALGSSAPARRELQIQRWQTAEGARVLFVEAHELPMFDLRLTFAAGSSQDGGNAGLALLTNAMLNEGVEGMDTTAIAAGFERLGAVFDNGAYRDMGLASLRSLSAAAQREPALELFSKVVSAPSFPEEALARIRNQILASLQQQQKSPGSLASLELFKRLYGDHPYASPSSGTLDSIPAISRQQLIDFHRRAYAAGNVVIALVGDLDRTQAEAIASQLSKALPQGPALPAPAQPSAPQAGRFKVAFPSQQTHLMLAQPGIDRKDPDYAALYVANQILGGGFGSRLTEEVREKRGLTYGIYSGFSPMQVRGPFMISVQTRAEVSEATLGLVRQLVRDFVQQGPTEAELAAAKRELMGSYPLTNASNSSIVGQLGMIGFYDLPSSQLEDFMQAVQALSVEQVHDALRRHVDPDAFVVVSVGPEVAQQPLPPPVDRPAERSAIPEH